MVDAAANTANPKSHKTWQRSKWEKPTPFSIVATVSKKYFIILLRYMLTINSASFMISGIVIIERIEESPTARAEYSGLMS